MTTQAFIDVDKYIRMGGIEDWLNLAPTVRKGCQQGSDSETAAWNAAVNQVATAVKYNDIP